jgi:hypothetical protein
MPNIFASGKWAISICDRCGFQFPLKELQTIVVKTKNVNIKVCQECWEPDQPQLQLGMYPVDDPQSLRNPRPDTSYLQAGYTGLQITTGPSELGDGGPSGGSRDIQWGWNPVGFNNVLQLPIPDNLEATGQVGTVTISTT